MELTVCYPFWRKLITSSFHFYIIDYCFIITVSTFGIFNF